MKTRIIFWTAPAILAAIIVVVLYQISLEEGNTLSVVLQQELQEEVGPEPEAEEISSQEAEPKEVQSEEEMQKPLLEKETPSNEPVAAVESPVKTKKPLPMKEEVAPVPKMSVEKASSEQKSSNKPTKTAEVAMEPLEKAALVETADTPWMIVSAKEKGMTEQWQTILIRNEHKLDYTILPQNSGNWKIVISGKQLKVQLTNEIQDRKDILSRKKKGKYAVQILSVERKYFDRAVQIVQDLVNDGYYAYLHRTKEMFEKKHWYRVRIGFFKTAEEAQSIGQEVYFRYRDVKELPQNYWAVLPSPRELDRELVDFQAQRNKPWVLELPEYDTKEKAIADLPELIEISEFAYLAYKQMDNKIHYRTRLGFFETEAEAKKRLNQLKRIRTSLANSKLVKL